MMEHNEMDECAVIVDRSRNGFPVVGVNIKGKKATKSRMHLQS